MAEFEKLTVLYLMKILLEETDRKHMLNADAICERMEKRYHVSCSRKTVYRDVDCLRSFGFDIELIKGSNSGYYLAKRDFELAELELLVDAVQAAKFITESKSRELIAKLEHLTSSYNAKYLSRQVYICNRPKAGNETIYRNVDFIHEAINRNRQISFIYCEWTVAKELRAKKHGEKSDLFRRRICFSKISGAPIATDGICEPAPAHRQNESRGQARDSLHLPLFSSQKLIQRISVGRKELLHKDLHLRQLSRQLLHRPQRGDLGGLELAVSGSRLLHALDQRREFIRCLYELSHVPVIFRLCAFEDL